MGAFLRHENACHEAIGVALKMNADTRMDAEQLSRCNSLLDLFGANSRLDGNPLYLGGPTLLFLSLYTGRLQHEGSQLVTSMSNVAGTPTSRSSQLSQTMVALAGVVHSRAVNLTGVQSLVESHQTNLRLHLEIGSLKITN